VKIYFYQKNKQNITTYTFELLKHIAGKNGHDVVTDVGGCDVVGISLTGFQEIDTLRIFRNRNPNVKIIVGGHICNNPSAVLRYADFVCLGHAFELFRDCKSVDDFYEQAYIIHKEKKGGVYSQYINWDLCPLIQISKNSYSILYSSGCRNKCKFCLTSWANKYQVNPYKGRLVKARHATKGKQLYLITNDYDQGVNVKRNVSDATVKEYLKNPAGYNGIKLLRLGVESPIEKTRRMFSKPIKDQDLQDFFKLTKKEKQRVNLFMIAGLNTQEEWEVFAELLDIDYIGSPKIGIVINYFDPQPLTPLAKYDLRKIININIPRIKRIWKIKSARIVIYRDLKLSPYNPIINTMLCRANWYDVDKILELKKKEKFTSGKIKEKKETGLMYFFDKIGEYGLNHLINGKHKSEFTIKTGQTFSEIKNGRT